MSGLVGRYLLASGLAFVLSAVGLVPPALAVTTPTVFGTQFHPGGVTPTLLSRAAEANISWVRYGDVRWSLIEPSPGQRDHNRGRPVSRITGCKCHVENGQKCVVRAGPVS